MTSVDTRMALVETGIDADTPNTFYEDQNRRIRINAGGTIFETFLGTLCNRSTYWRRALLEFNDADSGVVFLDKDPDVFRHVLNYLRDPRYPFPWNLLHELEWFGVEPPAPRPADPSSDPSADPPSLTAESNISVSGSAGYWTFLRPDDQTRETHRDPSEWYRKVTAVPRRITARSSFDTIEHPANQRQGFSSKILLPRNGDLIVRLVLSVRVRAPGSAPGSAPETDPTLRYSLFDSISLRMGNVVRRVDPVLLECVEEISLTPVQRAFMHKNGQQGHFFFDLPFFLEEDPIPMICLNFVEVDCLVEGVRNDLIEDMVAQTDYVYLNSHERRDVSTRREFPTTQWEKGGEWVIEPGTRLLTGRMVFTTPVIEFFVVVKPEGGPFQRIHSLALSADGREVISIGGDLLRYRMVMDEGVTSEKFIYRHRFHHDDGESLTLQRAGEVSLRIILMEPLNVASVVSFYYTTFNRIILVDGVYPRLRY